MIDNADYLNEWNKPEDDHFTEIEQGRPQWFKLWPEKYSVALDVEYLDELTPEEKKKTFEEAGICFINAILYFLQHDKEEYWTYKPSSPSGRILWHALKRDIDQSYRDYEERVQNGKKGGRPKNT